MPYIELQNLYRMYNQVLTNEDNAQIPFRQTIVKTYNCPSDINVGQLHRPDSGIGNAQEWRTSSYRAMSGRGYGPNGESWWFDDPTSGANLPVQQRGMLHGTSTPNVSQLRPEKFANVTDGSSNTVMLGEYATRNTPRRSSFWAYTYTSYNQSSAVPQSRTFNPDYAACAALGDSNPCKRAWGSFHSGGMNVAMGDGSGRFIRQNIDMNNVWVPLATIAGGEVVNLD